MKYLIAGIIILASTIKTYSQNFKEPINFYKDFKLGMSIDDLLRQHPELIRDSTNNFCCYSYYSEIKSNYMDKYWIRQLTLASGDDVSLKLGIYKGKLAIIIVAYKSYQSLNDILDALQAKYGDYSNIDQDFYNDPLAGVNKTDVNVYWKNQNYILNLCHTSYVGSTHILYADGLVQKDIKSRISKENLKKIE